MGDKEKAQKFHRFRFYPKSWSSFDSIEPCSKPEWCQGCEYKHQFCDASGRLIEEPQTNRSDYGKPKPG